nr:histidine kinase [Allomuricauda sp.]
MLSYGRFRIKLTACLLIVVASWLTAQEKTYTQIEVDSFVENHLSLDNLDTFKSILSSNPKLYGWTKYYSSLGYRYFLNKKNDSAEFYLKKAIENYEKSKVKHTLDEESLVQTFFAMGLIYRAKKKYKNSIEYLVKSLDVEKKHPYKYRSYILAYIAGNHLSLGNEKRALTYYQKTLKDSIYSAIPQANVVNLTRLGVLYTKNYLDNKDSAYYYLKEAEKSSYAKGYTDNLPFIYSNLGGVFKGNNLDSTLFYFRKSKELYESYQIIENISPTNPDLEILVNNSYIDLWERNYNTAIKNLDFAIDKLKYSMANKNDRDILMDAYDYLIMAYEQNDNHEKANKYLKEKEVYSQKFHEQELAAELEKISVAYETKEKEERISKLEVENQNKELKVSQQKAQLIFGALIVAILFVTMFLFFRQRVIGEKLKKIALEQRLLRSQMNPHFMFNVLQSISAIIDSSPKKAQRLITEFGGLLRLSLENSREDFVEMDHELEALRKYLEVYANTVTPFDYRIEIAPELNPNQIMIPPMLIQPLVENAIKHGVEKNNGGGEIEVRLSLSKRKLFIRCQVEDNGNGFKTSLSASKKSLALDILKERLEKYTKLKEDELFQIKNPGNINSENTVIQILIPTKFA